MNNSDDIEYLTNLTSYEEYIKLLNDALINNHRYPPTYSDILGGSYAKVASQYEQWRSETTDKRQYQQAHHIPAYAAYKGIVNLSYRKGATVMMEMRDHENTASHGSVTDSKLYIKEQRKHIAKGRLDYAVKMDINDIRGLFGTKYDIGIVQAEEYLCQLDKLGKLSLPVSYKSEVKKRVQVVNNILSLQKKRNTKDWRKRAEVNKQIDIYKEKLNIILNKSILACKAISYDYCQDSPNNARTHSSTQHKRKRKKTNRNHHDSIDQTR